MVFSALLLVGGFLGTPSANAAIMAQPGLTTASSESASPVQEAAYRHHHRRHHRHHHAH
jgi:hypothetical protein